MIATTPVARWAWGRDDDTGDDLTRCLRDALAALAVLARHQFASQVGELRVSVKEAGVANTYLFRGDIPVRAGGSSLREDLDRVADQVRGAMSSGEIGAVDVSVTCGGPVATAHGQELVERLFLLGASAFAEFVTVDLLTYTDAWLPYDLKGRPQPEVHLANAPRLAAVLHDLAETLGSETEPDDPTYFAKPSETGAENFFTAEGKASDVWRSFEIPRRYDVFLHAPGFGRIGYSRKAKGEVKCLPVESAHGLLGYVWASDGENAAGFEPTDVGDDLVYRAGLVWLERLQRAHGRGLTPEAALEELSGLLDEDGAGYVVTSEGPRSVSLDALRESTNSD
ncbi:hypothetical protein [Streptomyces griseoaurantiacus]|uniref:Uncharacterized protein n=1 Tax=Streptomyces griseoaurantiacus TaxID=68213 RepID=A0A7W2E020_9ACTN|nr:hypothetical protein [Streptomyces griseoaurantiacus]MBA5226011.1 hypothetical protein [Streptomyces griseoaurantiacus]